MRKWSAVLTVAFAIAALAGAPQTEARAVEAFKIQFRKRYVGDGTTAEQKAIAAAMDAAKCTICHEPHSSGAGKPRNEYGKELAKLITKRDRKDEKKIQDALAKVESLKSADGKTTYGELLRAGKLPVEFKSPQ